MPRLILLILFCLFGSGPLYAQPPFADRCLGTWRGTMHIWSKGTLKDSVAVRLTVAKTDQPNVWTWRTDYLSQTRPMTKDYKLRLADTATGRYVTDEGEGLELYDYQFGNKLYNVFETAGVTLTATYELVSDALIFEVTSGKKQAATFPDVVNFSVDNLQRVVFRRDN